jgi:S1-C subfamily serine protease
LSVTDLDASMIRRFGMPDSLVGVLITDVDAAGPARLARVHAGEVLLEINRHRVASTVEFRAMAAALRPGETVALLIYDRLSDQRTIHAVSIDPQ